MRRPPHGPDSRHHEVASDGGAESCAVVASLVETRKLDGADPFASLADTLTRIVDGHLASEIDDLLPWAYATAPQLKDAA